MKKYTNMLLVAMLAAMCFSIDASSGASVYSFKHDSDVLLGEDEVVALYVGGKLKHERADYISLSDALEDLGIEAAHHLAEKIHEARAANHHHNKFKMTHLLVRDEKKDLVARVYGLHVDGYGLVATNDVIRLYVTGENRNNGVDHLSLGSLFYLENEEAKALAEDINHERHQNLQRFHKNLKSHVAEVIAVINRDMIENEGALRELLKNQVAGEWYTQSQIDEIIKHHDVKKALAVDREFNLKPSGMSELEVEDSLIARADFINFFVSGKGIQKKIDSALIVKLTHLRDTFINGLLADIVEARKNAIMNADGFNTTQLGQKFYGENAYQKRAPYLSKSDIIHSFEMEMDKDIKANDIINQIMKHFILPGNPEADKHMQEAALTELKEEIVNARVSKQDNKKNELLDGLKRDLESSAQRIAQDGLEKANLELRQRDLNRLEKANLELRKRDLKREGLLQGGDLPKDSLVKDILSSSNETQESFEYENPMESEQDNKQNELRDGLKRDLESSAQRIALFGLEKANLELRQRDLNRLKKANLELRKRDLKRKGLLQGGDLPKDSLVKDIFSSSNETQESFEYENPMKSKNSMESEAVVKFSKGGLLGAKDDARHKASDKLHNRGFDRNKDKAFAALAGYNRSKAILPKAKKVDKGQELDQSGALVLPPLPDSPSEDEEVGFSSRELQLLQEANISADKLLDFVTLLPY